MMSTALDTELSVNNKVRLLSSKQPLSELHLDHCLILLISVSFLQYTLHSFGESSQNINQAQILLLGIPRSALLLSVTFPSLPSSHYQSFMVFWPLPK